MKAKEIWLLILIVLGGILLFQVHTGRLDIDGGWGDGWIGRGETFTYMETQTVDEPIPSRIVIRNEHGDIDVRGEERADVSLTFRKKIRRENEEEALAVSNKLKPAIRKEGDSLVIASNREEFKTGNVDTDWTLLVPKGLDVTIENAYGTVKLDGVRSGSIDNRHGSVSVAGVDGPVTIVNSYEDVEVDRIQSSCHISCRHADVRVRNAGGEVRIENEHGNVLVEDAAADAVVSGEHIEVIGRRIRGRVNIRNSYEKVTLTGVGPAEINGHHSDVEAGDVSGGLKIRSNYANIRVNRVQGGLDVDGKSLAVTARSARGGDIRVVSSYEDVEILDFTGKTAVFLSHGDAVLVPASIDFPIEVTNSYSTIHFTIPEGGCGPLEARSQGGEVHWGLSAIPSLNQTNGEALVKAFLDRTDISPVSLRTSYADIEIGDGPRQPVVIE
ncbi:MAG: DUF4097 family beta strand repeat-containing protein [Candidatus Aminicenantales bacterium]